MHYYVIEAESIDDLVREMLAWLRADWRPLGGVQVEDGKFYQSLVRPV